MITYNSDIDWSLLGIEFNDIKSYKLLYGSKYGTGYYSKTPPKRNCKSFKAWEDIMRQCFGEKTHTICEEWLDYWNFHEWYDENKIEIDGEKTFLIADLVNSTNHYSPSTTLFVPRYIYTSFVSLRKNCKPKLGENGRVLPEGISCRKLSKDYIYSVYISFCGEKVFVCTSHNIDDALQKMKNAQEEKYKKLADKYKDKINAKLYEYMMTLEWKEDV